MLRNVAIVALMLAFCAVPMTALAQKDAFGETDTLYAELAKIDANNWSVTLSYTNDQPVAGMSIPLQMAAGQIPIVADSAVYTGGRVDHFAFKGFRPDTGIQCVTLGLVANLGPTKNILEPGTGRLVTVFVSALNDDKPIGKLLVDTTTTAPNNSLMAIADRSLLGELDSTTVERMATLEIVPALVIRQPE